MLVNSLAEETLDSPINKETGDGGKDEYNDKEEKDDGNDDYVKY